MKVIFYTDGLESTVDNLDDVQVVLPGINPGGNLDRHIKVTGEGIIVDIVDDEGMVASTMSITHEEMLPTPNDEDES
jgi:hypothetical protein